MPTKVVMPQLGESVVEGTVTKWLVPEGSQVKEFDALLEVNTDKVDTEVPSPATGIVLKILVPEGTTVTAGTVLAYIGQPGEAAPEDGAPSNGSAHRETVPAPPHAGTPEQSQPQPSAGRDLGFISPVVARIAREHSIDLQQVQGTGEGGRITKKDVLAFIETGAKPPAPQSEPAAWETPGEGDLFRPVELQFPEKAGQPQPGATTPKPAPLETPLSTTAGGDRLIPLTHLRRSIAEPMVASERTSPHVTTVMEADLRRVVAHREANKAAFARDGVNLTYTAYFVAAAVAALRAFPIVNSSWSEQGILVHPGIHIGMAASLGEDGLIVPVIKGADGLSLLGLARAVNDLAARARARRLQPDEVKGGTFTITNHGISGSLFATPIINQPQCAILGVGAIQKRVVVIDDAIAIRPMAYLSLTFDHRILDGASGDGFLAKVIETLENWV